MTDTSSSRRLGPDRAAALALAAFLLSLAACSSGQIQEPHEDGSADAVASSGSGTGETAPASPEPLVDPRFVARLEGIAARYEDFGRFDDRVRWAPTDCRMPTSGAGRISRASGSRSGDGAGTHGRKLYYLYAADREAYVGRTDAIDAVGPVLVKEAWGPEEFRPAVEQRSFVESPVGHPTLVRIDTGPKSPDAAKAARRGVAGIDDPGVGTDPDLRPVAEHGGRTYRPGASRGLFVMFRLDPDTGGTDSGWVYGTVDRDGRVTAAGRIRSCMECHGEAPHGRVFGVE